MPQQSHIAYRVDVNTLLNEPEAVLQRMSFKILEKREQVLHNLIGTKVQFKVSNGIEQGKCEMIHGQFCTVKVGNQTVKVALKKLIL